MTKNNITSSNYINHTTFGGVITIEDFNTHSPNKKRISNQIDANNLPETIKKEQIKNDCIETAEVMLNGAMLSSVTYFGLEINSYKG